MERPAVDNVYPSSAGVSTPPCVDCDEIDNLTNEASAIVLESDVDVRVYSKHVEEQLQTLEAAAVDACKRMETILATFHKDLGTISSDIQDLQTRSITMHQRLQNRQAVRGELSQLLSDMIVPESMIEHVFLTSATDQGFVENLHELDHKLNMIGSQDVAEYPFCQDVGSLLKKLQIKAATKIREFLLEKIRALRKPMANYQVPQVQLLRYRYYYEFLLIHERDIAREIRVTYISTMERVYFAYFKTYASKLLKLQLDSNLEKDELVGTKLDDLTSVAATASASSVQHPTVPAPARPGHFGLGDRAERLLSKVGLQAAILLPHAVAKNDAKYPLEEIFRSINYALLDTACREYVFLGDFFLHHFGSPVPGGPDKKSEKVAAHLFEKVFGRTVNVLEVSVVPQFIQLGQSDLLGLLLCVQLVHAMIRLTTERNIKVLESYWFSLLDIVWSRVVDRMEAHIASLRLLDVTQFAQAASLHLRNLGINEHTAAATLKLSPKAHSLIRPHPVARRYAELAASLHSIGSGSPANNAEAGTTPTGLDARVELALSRMHAEFEAAIYRLTKVLPRNRLRLVFLINNFDLFITVLSEKGASDALEVGRCREAVQLHTTAYVDEALLPYFGSMIGFIQTVEKRTQGGDSGAAASAAPSPVDQHEEARVTQIVKGFNIDWKNSIEKINGEIMLEFANFTLGTQIFHALLSQFVQLYHRLQKVMSLPPFNAIQVRNQLVSIHQIMNEVKGFKSNY